MNTRAAGSVRRRGETWCFTVDVGAHPETGKRRQLFRGGFATKREAQASLDNVRSKLHGGEYVQPNKLTVEEFLKSWLDVRKTQVRRSTHESYARNVRVHVNPRLGGVRLQGLTALDLERAYADMTTAGLSARSVRYVHTIISGALKNAVRKSLVPRNVAMIAELPRATQREARPWDADELRSFLDYTRRERLSALWHALATTGVRRGEALGLCWSDVDLDGKRMTIRRALIAIGYAIEFSEPKTARGRRSIRLDDGTVAVLREHRKRQSAERLAAGPAWRDEGLVFCREDGTPLHPDAITKLFRRQVKAAKLRTIRLHDLRHTSATLLLGQGIHPRAVADRLGHADATLVLRVYGHTLADVESRAADALGELLAPVAAKVP